nr:acidic repeat-containing protein-like [Procambarus clarkii]
MCDHTVRQSTQNLLLPISKRDFPLTTCDDNIQLYYSNDFQAPDPPRHTAQHDDLKAPDPPQHSAQHDDLKAPDPPRHSAQHDDLKAPDPPRHSAQHDDLKAPDPPRHSAQHDDLKAPDPPQHSAQHDDLKAPDPPQHSAQHDDLKAPDPPRHSAQHYDLQHPRSKDTPLVSFDDLPATCVFSDSLICLTELPHLDQLVALQPLQCFLATAAQVETSPQTQSSSPAPPKSQPDATVPAINMTYGTQRHQMALVTPTTASHLTHIRERKKKCRSVYKHVPHREKPPHLVARRNARERRRVQSVNVAFARLRRVVPCTSSRTKRVSKAKTLQGAIDYIYHLQDLLHHNNNPITTTNTCFPLHSSGLTNTCNMLVCNTENSSNTCSEGDQGPAGRCVGVVGCEGRPSPVSNTTWCKRASVPDRLCLDGRLLSEG